MVAIQRGGSVQMCQYLVNMGASLNIKNTQGLSPIECCKMQQRNDLVAILELETANPINIKIPDLLKPLQDESEVKVEEFTIPPEVLRPTNEIVCKEIYRLWKASKFMKKLYRNSLRKMGAKYVLLGIKDQLMSNKTEFPEGLPTSLILEGLIGTKKQPYTFYLFENVLILAIPNKTQKKKMVVKHVIALKTINENEFMETEDEGLFVRLIYTPMNTNKQDVLEIPVPDGVFINALVDQIDNNHTESDDEDWFEDFKNEMNLIPRSIFSLNGEDINMSCHEDEARSESQSMHDDKD